EEDDQGEQADARRGETENAEENGSNPANDGSPPSFCQHPQHGCRDLGGHDCGTSTTSVFMSVSFRIGPGSATAMPGQRVLRLAGRRARDCLQASISNRVVDAPAARSNRLVSQAPLTRWALPQPWVQASHDACPPGLRAQASFA